MSMSRPALVITMVWTALAPAQLQPKSSAFSLPLIDLDGHRGRQVIVDREKGQYLGHPSTVLLEDGKTILCVYPKGHGRGPIQYKRSIDGGKTWSERLPTPKSWETSLETPTVHRVADVAGKKRIILFSGLYPVRLAVSEDDGRTWSELKKVGDWGGVVTMASVIALKTGPGHYLAMFHDDGRFISSKGKPTGVFTLYQTRSTDGGLIWSTPKAIYKSDQVHLCEPGAFRSPDGKQIAVLLRENRRLKNSHVMFSDDEGITWTQPREVPGSLTGDRHVAKYGPDGRLFISFRDVPPKSSSSVTAGDWVGWVGTYEDIVKNNPGQYRVRLKKNYHSWDCAYPGIEVLPDGTFVATTYGHWTPNEPPYILSVRFMLSEFDALAASAASTQHQIVCTGKAAGGYAAFPDLCRLPNGELLCVFYSGYGHVSVPNDKWPKGGRIMAVRSTDNGKTWSSPFVIIDTDQDDRDPSIACLKDGTLLLNWFTLHQGKLAVRLARSSDQGKSWSDPVRLKLDSPYSFACSSPVRELPDGSLILGLYCEDEKTRLAIGATVKSYDGGKSWKDLALIGEKAGIHLDAETDMVSLKSGKLLAALRSSKVDMHYATSDDAGKTWGPVQSFGFKGHCPYFLRHSSGIILLAHRLPGTSLHWTADEGKTWNGPVQIDSVIGAYPSMVELSDGSVYCVYYEEGKGSSIRAARLKVDLTGVKVLTY